MSKLKEMRKADSESKGFNMKLLALPVVGLIAVIVIIAFLSQPPTGLATLPDETQEQDQGQGPSSEPVIGEIKTFTDTGKEIELRDGKPVIRLFSTTRCPHCTWVKNAFDSVMREYEGRIVAHHWELDIKDDTLTAAAEGSVPESEYAIFLESNPQGFVPTFVFGGKYYRIGNGYERENDLASEEAEFRGVIEALLTQVEE